MDLAVVLTFSARLAGTASGGQFPVPRAEREFVSLIPYVQQYCSVIKTDEERFLRAVLPFGPLDLSISNGTREEIELLRNLYLGLAGRACDVDAVALAKSFHCGKSCVERRFSDVREKLAAIKGLVKSFLGLKGVNLISQWGVVGEYRVDSAFTMMNQMKETKPSSVMGFVPSDSWVDQPGLVGYLERRGISQKSFESVLAQVKRLSLAALVRESGWVRVIRFGIADNESGLIFLPIGAVKPAVGQKTRDGREYVIVQELEKGIVFYETT